MEELIKTLKKLGADKDKEDLSNVEKKTLKCTMSFNYDKPVTWEYCKLEKRMFEDEIKEIELKFIDMINNKGAKLNPYIMVSHELCKFIIEKNEPATKVFNDACVESIFNRLKVINYYLKTRNHNLIAVTDDKLQLNITGPIEKKCKNFITDEDEIVYEYDFRGEIKIKIIDKED